ncbi:MAG: LCP family protein [Actinomycetota bacterium]|nr:LCP family protein [Actinomycetota bacterium]
MREFHDYTRESGAARRRRWLWFLPIGLVVAALSIGVGIGAVPIPMETLGYGPNGGSGDSQDQGEGSRPGMIDVLFGDSGDITQEPMNVLVVGVDKRPPDSKEAKVQMTRTDTMMLVRLVPKTGEVKLLSVPRDLLLEIAPGVEDRINAAYAYGGIEQTMGALENYTEVPIDHYAIVDFAGFEAVVNAMGGVEVDVEDELPSEWNMEEGIQRLNGARALRYARYRDTACGDIDRIRRQQQLVAALRSKALRWNTVTKLPEIAKVMNENVETDFGLEDAITLGRVLVRRGLNAQMTSTQLRGTPDTLENGNEVLVPDDTANEAILERFLSEDPDVRPRGVAGPAGSSEKTC